MLSVCFSSCNRVPPSHGWSLPVPPAPGLAAQPLDAAQLGSGRSGRPTLAVWPKVTLAALGRVDDHGAVPAAAVPP